MVRRSVYSAWRASLCAQSTVVCATSVLLVTTSAFIRPNYQSWVSLISVPAIARGSGIAVRIARIGPWLQFSPSQIVGAGNHRQFLLFVFTLVIGICFFDYLTYACKFILRYSLIIPHLALADFSAMQVSTDPLHLSPSCVLPGYLCAITAADTFLVAVSAWATLQLSWTLVLLITQLWQVARQMTTLEVSNLGRYGFMGGRGGATLGQQMGHAHQHTGSEDTASGSGHHHHRHGACGGGGGMIMNLLGFDRFTKGKAADGLARAAKAPNPFHLGLAGNCKDFWTMGRELGVEYERLYDVPPEGFVEAKRTRMREDGEDGGRKSLRQSLLMGLGLGRSGSRSGYEPLSQV